MKYCLSRLIDYINYHFYFERSEMGIPRLSLWTNPSMYQITNGIIHAYIPNTRTRGSHDFKYYVEHVDNDVFK